MKKASAALFGLLVTSPALFGAKCVEYDERFAAATNAGSTADAGNTPAADAGALPAGDGQACNELGLAKLTVKDRKFSISCGCVEGSGTTCTVPVGTKVRWTFIDSEEHVVSGGPEIGKSDEKSVGTHEAVFNTAGIFRYSCSIHANMKGYSIVVR